MRKLRKISIANTLRRLLTLPVFITFITICVATFWSASERISTVYDAQMVTDAYVLWLINLDDDEAENLTVELEAKNIDLANANQKDVQSYMNMRAFRIWRNGKLVITSDNARPGAVLPGSTGFADFNFEGEGWRSYTLHVPKGDVIVEIDEQYKARQSFVLTIMVDLLWPLLILLPVIFLLIRHGVQSGLSGLYGFASQISARPTSDISPISAVDLPVELRPLHSSLNQLLEKLNASIIHERMFLDTAAHQLRTPLAALKIQAQLVAAAETEANRRASVEELSGGVDRAARLVAQMLLLARTRDQSWKFASVNLFTVLREVIKRHVPLIIAKNIDLSLVGDENVTNLSHPELLSAMFGNLIDNAIKYSPAGGEILVAVGVREGTLEVSIADQGTGILPEDRERVFERFYRLEHDIYSGSGLGLSIVRNVADLLKIHIRIDTGADGQGSIFTLLFPATPVGDQLGIRFPLYENDNEIRSHLRF